MSLLFWLRYGVRSLLRSGRRAVFALTCIAIGVAAVVALQIATLTVQSALVSNVKAANGGDVSLSSQDTPLSRSDLRVFSTLQKQGAIVRWTAVSSLHATAVTAGGQIVPFDVNAVSAPPYPLGGQPTFVTPSNGQVAALLGTPGSVLVSTVLADELGVHLGDRLTVNGIGGPGLQATVRGILAETSFQHAAVMTVQNRDAAMLTSAPPHYTAVYADVSGSAAPVATVLRQRFPLATVQTVQEALQATEAQVHDFRQFMLLVGLLALLIAGIGILNAMQSILSWRRLEIAMLKTVGFRRGTLYALFAVEAVILGLLGGLAGTIIGAVASKIITDALARALGVQVTFQLDTGTLLGGIALGIGATLVFAVLPIARASGLRPIEILREGGTGVTTAGVAQSLGLLLLVLFLFTVLAAAIVGDAVLAAEFVAGAGAAFLVLTGVIALLVGSIGRLGPPRSRLLAALATVLLAALAVLATHVQPALAAMLVLATLLAAATLLPQHRLLPLLIAVRSLSRRQARTSVTLVAFLVGVLAMSLTLTVALSLQRQISDALAQNSTSNLVALASPERESTVLRVARRLPGVNNWTAATVVQTTPTRINGRPIAGVVGPAPAAGRGGDAVDDRGYLLGGIAGIDLRHGAQPSGIQVVAGRPLNRGDAGTNGVLVRSDLQAPPWNMTVGSTITLRDTANGLSRTTRVVGFYQRARRRAFGSFFSAPIYGDRSLAVALGGSDAQSVLSFSVDPNQLTADAAALQRAVPGVLVIDIGDLTRVIQTVLGELLNILAVITALALGAGLAVVANGVALAMLERRREIALYKAIGFAPANVVRFVLVENALAGLLAGSVSILLVVAALSLLSHFALQQAIGFDPLVATLVLLLAAALAVLTAYLAARAPVRIRPIEVLRNE